MGRVQACKRHLSWLCDAQRPACSPLPACRRPCRSHGCSPRPQVCSNCHTNSTPFWRKDRTSGLPLCNACGLYAAKNDHPRPVKLWREGQVSGVQPSLQLQQAQQPRHCSPAGAAAAAAGAMQQAAAQLQLLQRGSASPQALPQQRQQAAWPPIGGAGPQAGDKREPLQGPQQAMQPAAAAKEASLEPQPTLTPPAEQHPRSSPAQQQEREPSTTSGDVSPVWQAAQPPTAAVAVSPPLAQQQQEPPRQQQQEGGGDASTRAAAELVAALVGVASRGAGGP